MTKNTLNHIKPLKIPKIIRVSAKLIAFFSDKWAAVFAARLFISPIKHRLPKREIKMDINSLQKNIEIPEIKRKINIYLYGKSTKTVLLVHGWSGRGTQLCHIAAEMLKMGYQTLSFDAPAHGKSPGNKTVMIDFIASILELEKQFGPFEVAIGHSLGGMSVLNAIKRGFAPDKAVIIGSGDRVSDIIDGFIRKLELKPNVGLLMQRHLEKRYGKKMEDYDAYKGASKSKIPTLVIHDENDNEVDVNAGIHIYENLSVGELQLTKGLGHRKILADPKVIESICNFIKQ